MTRLAVAKPELGTKRVDPETGRKFYDLNKDPIVSPYTGKSYPRSYFEEGKISAIEDDEDVADKEIDAEEEEGAEIVSLEDADEETKSGGDDLPDLGDDEDDVDLGDDDDDTFLADEEEEDDDVADMIGVGDDEDEV
nr:TIGR02300 family protein [Mesorhizobium silamurunense]